MCIHLFLFSYITTPLRDFHILLAIFYYYFILHTNRNSANTFVFSRFGHIPRWTPVQWNTKDQSGFGLITYTYNTKATNVSSTLGTTYETKHVFHSPNGRYENQYLSLSAIRFNRWWHLKDPAALIIRRVNRTVLGNRIWTEFSSSTSQIFSVWRPSARTRWFSSDHHHRRPICIPSTETGDRWSCRLTFFSTPVAKNSKNAAKTCKPRRHLNANRRVIVNTEYRSTHMLITEAK